MESQKIYVYKNCSRTLGSLTGTKQLLTQMNLTIMRYLISMRKKM